MNEVFQTMSFLNHLISGISLGSIYAIIALGYTMVYGIAKMLNFAHGDVIMVGGYMCFCATTYLGWPAWMGVVLAIIVCTVLGMAIERLAYSRCAAPSLAVLITAIGVSYFLQNAALLIWTSNPKSFSSVVTGEAISLFGGQIQISRVTLVIVFSLRCHHGRAHAVHRQEQGRHRDARGIRGQGRGPADGHQCQHDHFHHLCHRLGSRRYRRRAALLRLPDPDADDRLPARHQGLHRSRIRRHRLDSGAFIGGVLLGIIIEIFAKAYISTQLSDAIVFGVLIVVLLVKPDGLLGKHVSEKV